MRKPQWEQAPVERLEEVLRGWGFGPRECPNDRTTLTVDSAEDGQLVLSCSAGCDSAKILPGLGLAWVPFVKNYHEDAKVAKSRRAEMRHRSSIRSPERVAPAAAARKVTMRPASKIPTRRARWMWADLIPLRTATIVAGIGGIGKSTAWADVVARLTRGTLPGEYEGAPIRTAVMAYEDTWEEVIKPRLLAAGADLDYVLQVRVEREDADDFTTDVIELPADLPALREAVVENKVHCLVIDPVLSSFDGKFNTNNSREVRKVLDPLGQLAAEVDLAVIAIHHLRKDADNPDAAISGAHAFRDAARSVLMFTTDHARDDGSCLMFHMKSNYGVTAPPRRYRIEAAEIRTDDGPAEVGRVLWLGDDAGAVWETVARRNPGPGRESAEVAEAVAWLREELEAGAKWNTEQTVKAGRADHGFSRDTVRRAIKALPARAVKQGFGKGAPVYLEILDRPEWAGGSVEVDE